MAARLRRSLVTLGLTALGFACSGSGSGSGEESAGPKHDRLTKARDTFYERAAEGHWYVVGGKTFSRLAPGLPGYVVPEDPQAKTARLLDAHHFSCLDIAPSGERFAAKSNRFGAAFENAHLLIFDDELEVVYEDRGETDVGQKGDNTRSAIRWSPDGASLVYAQSGKIWLIEPDTREPEAPGRRMIADDHQMRFIFEAPSWGPGGELVYENAAGELTLLRVATGAKRVLRPGRFPSWSPDGARIVYRDQDEAAVRVHDVASGSAAELFVLRNLHPHYLWTPDSRYVLVHQKISKSNQSNYYLYSFEDAALIDLRLKSYTLDDRLVEALPPWLEAKLVPLEPS